MQMQICRMCNKLDFIYVNRGEVCFNCCEMVPHAEDFKQEELAEEVCPYYCRTSQTFAPYKRQDVQVGR